LGAATERVANGDFSVEFVPTTGGELAELSTHFNRMVARLRANRAEIEARLDELRAANEELERAQSEVVRSERLATVGTLAAGIAHEVGNPLSAVIGLVSLIAEPGLLDDAERADTLQRITRELRRIDGIIRELLTFARASDGAAEHCDPRAPIEVAVRLCQHHDRGRGVEVEVSLEDELPEIAASESQMVQVLLNLLVNAADAMNGGGRIHVTASRVSGGVALDVADHGPGVDASTQARIFDPFFTTKAPGKGTGLGLAIVERLVSQWGGRIEIHSEAGQGTRFRVVVPEHAGGVLV
jgi:signal transduction histidine kinase